MKPLAKKARVLWAKRKILISALISSVASVALCWALNDGIDGASVQARMTLYGSALQISSTLLGFLFAVAAFLIPTFERGALGRLRAEHGFDRLLGTFTTAVWVSFFTTVLVLVAQAVDLDLQGWPPMRMYVIAIMIWLAIAAMDCIRILGFVVKVLAKDGEDSPPKR